MVHKEKIRLDKLCYDWLIKIRSSSVFVSRILVGATAKEIARQFNYSKFYASTGWWPRFKTRHNIKLKTVSSEAAHVNIEDVDDYICKIKPLQS